MHRRAFVAFSYLVVGERQESQTHSFVVTDLPWPPTQEDLLVALGRLVIETATGRGEHGKVQGQAITCLAWCGPVVDGD